MARGIKNDDNWTPRACVVCGKEFVPKTGGGKVCPGKGVCWRTAATRWHRDPANREKIIQAGRKGGKKRAITLRQQVEQRFLREFYAVMDHPKYEGAFAGPRDRDLLMGLFMRAYDRGYQAGKTLENRKGKCRKPRISSPALRSSDWNAGSCESSGISLPAATCSG